MDLDHTVDHEIRALQQVLYSEAVERQPVRRPVYNRIVFGLIVVEGALIVLALLNSQTGGQQEWVNQISTAVAGLLGATVGFYFGGSTPTVESPDRERMSRMVDLLEEALRIRERSLAIERQILASRDACSGAESPPQR